MITLIHGEALQEIRKLENNSIDLVCIDPPYITTKENWDSIDSVTISLVRELFRIAKDSCSIYIWCGIGENSQSLIRWFPLFRSCWHFKDLITWKKRRGIGMRKGWLYTREECMWFVKNNDKFTWNKDAQYSKEPNEFKIGMSGTPVHETKRFTNVWADIPEPLSRNTKLHYTPKPIPALTRIVNVHTKPGDTVLDCFMGSGTMGITCKNLNRNFIGIEVIRDIYNIAVKAIEDNTYLLKLLR